MLEIYRPFVKRGGLCPGAVVAAVALALLNAACGNNSTTASPAAPTPTSPATETFASTLTAQGAAFRTFTASQAGNVSVTLVSDGPPTIPFGLGLGIQGGVSSPSTAGCNLTIALNTAPGDIAQITAPVDAGSYCAGIYDIGNIGSGTVNFSVQIVHP